MKSYFVTGIGTNVGKTFAASVLTEALGADYWKPVQTGPLSESDTETVKRSVSNARSRFFEPAYYFSEPASPHIAAALEGREIDMNQILLPDSSNTHLIIEGAGGVLVPLTSRHFVIELAKRFQAEVILVCRNYLGCINHSLLSMDYLRHQGYPVKGLILNGKFDDRVRSTLLEHAGLPVLAELEDIGQVSKTGILEQAQRINLNLLK